MVFVMYDRDYVLEKVDVKYDTVRGMDKKRFITIQDVIDNEVVNYAPECCPEYLATFRDIGGKIMKISFDMSKYENREKITFYPYI